MINWFQNRKKKKKVAELEQRLVDRLTLSQPKMGAIYSNSKLSTIVSLTTPIPSLQLLHSINGPYFEKNKGRHKDNYNLNGIQIKELHSDTFVDLQVEVTWDLISKIIISNPDYFWDYYDIDSIRLTDLFRTDVQAYNDDEEKLRKILKNVGVEHLNKLEIDDCFEIELDDKKFLTILDMEDGNYIAVSGRGHVFRLNHDSDTQVKLIHKSVDTFAREFSGDKKDLEVHFES